MRTTLLAFAIAVSGMSGNLQAAPRRHPVVHKAHKGETAHRGEVAARRPAPGRREEAAPVRAALAHKVRRGETAAKIAQANGLSMAELAALNPRVNLHRLAPGTSLRLAVAEPVERAEPKRAAALPVPRMAPLPSRAAAPAGSRPSASGPVAPLPETPNVGPASLVHLERILPFDLQTQPPAELATSDQSSVRSLPSAVPSLAGLRQVPIPQDDADLALPAPLTATSGFEAADRRNLDLLWPVETRTISSPWGPRIRTRVVRVKLSRRTRSKLVLRRFMGTHKGVDLSAPQGADIYSALDGQVVASGFQREYGNFVAVDHGGGVLTLYAHCFRNFVRDGDLVRRGQKIAEVGRTGNATGPHLHFELRLDGMPRNPLPVLNDAAEIPSDLVAQNSAAVPPAPQR